MKYLAAFILCCVAFVVLATPPSVLKKQMVAPASGGGGPNTYYYITNSHDASAINFGGGESYWDWGTIVIAQSGTLTAMEVNLHSVIANGSFKMFFCETNAGVYQTGLTSTFSVTTAFSADTWSTQTLSHAISAGTYYVVISSDATAQVSINSQTLTGGTSYHSGNTYAAAPGNLGGNIPAGGTEGKIMMFRAFVQ